MTSPERSTGMELCDFFFSFFRKACSCHVLSPELNMTLSLQNLMTNFQPIKFLYQNCWSLNLCDSYFFHKLIQLASIYWLLQSIFVLKMSTILATCQKKTCVHVNVTEFWKITLMDAPEIIRIFEFTAILLTLQNTF